MKKLIALFTICLFVLGVGMGFSSVKIQKAHKGMKKDGKRVSCVYCHGKGAKKLYPKKKANYLKGQAKYKKLKKDKLCSGSGCHG